MITICLCGIEDPKWAIALVIGPAIFIIVWLGKTRCPDALNCPNPAIRQHPRVMDQATRALRLIFFVWQKEMHDVALLLAMAEFERSRAASRCHFWMGRTRRCKIFVRTKIGSCTKHAWGQESARLRTSCSLWRKTRPCFIATAPVPSILDQHTRVQVTQHMDEKLHCCRNSRPLLVDLLLVRLACSYIKFQI